MAHPFAALRAGHLDPETCIEEGDRVLLWFGSGGVGKGSTGLYLEAMSVVELCGVMEELVMRQFPNTGMRFGTVSVCGVYDPKINQNITGALEGFFCESLGKSKPPLEDCLEQLSGVHLLALPVTYNNHTSLVVVTQPFADKVSNSSCITHLDSLPGLLHDHNHIMRTTKEVIDCMREHLSLPTKVLAQRDNTEIPRQLDGSNACGYYTVWNYGTVLYMVMASNTTTYFQYEHNKTLKLDYSPVAPLLFAQWAKDHVLVPQLPADKREAVAAVQLFSDPAAMQLFQPIPDCSQVRKGQHEACRSCLRDLHCSSGRVTRSASQQSAVARCCPPGREGQLQQLVLPTPDFLGSVAQQDGCATESAAAGAAAGPSRQQGKAPMAPPPPRPQPQMPAQGQQSQPLQQGTKRGRGGDEDDGSGDSGDYDEDEDKEEPELPRHVKAARDKCEAAAKRPRGNKENSYTSTAPVDSNEQLTRMEVRLERMENRLMDLTNTRGSPIGSKEDALAWSNLFQPVKPAIYTECCRIFAANPYPSRLHLHGAILLGLRCKQLSDLNWHFSSPEACDALFKEQVKQVKTHFTSDTRGKADRVLRASIILHYGLQPQLPPPLAAANTAPAAVSTQPASTQPSSQHTASRKGSRHHRLLGSPSPEPVSPGDAAAAAVPQVQEEPAAAAIAAAAAAAAQEEKRRYLVRQQASNAKSSTCPPPEEVFSPEDLAAIRTGAALHGGRNFDDPRFADVVNDFLDFQDRRLHVQQRSSDHQAPPGAVTARSVSTQVLGYILAMLTRYLLRPMVKPGPHAHIENSSKEIFGLYNECLAKVEAVYDTNDFMLPATRFEVLKSDGGASHMQRGASAAAAAGLGKEQMAPLREWI